MDPTRDVRTELDAPADRRVLWLTVVYAVALLGILVAVSLVLWPRYPDCERVWDLDCNPKLAGQRMWPVQNPIVMFVPFDILEWAFAGGMVAVLYRLATRRGLPAGRRELYGWAIAKPVIGLFMGSLVYFLALAAAKLLDGKLGDALWLNVVAFVGGFSDDFSVGLIQRFVRRRLGEDAREEKVGGERREPAGGSN